MKTISILIPTYNEENNVLPLYSALRGQLATMEDRYDYELVFIDNKSADGTREMITQLCAQDKRVKAIFNARNFGSGNSAYYGVLQTTGDCTIFMTADFQDPPELLPRMVEAWEQGHKIVTMVKTQSRENLLMRVIRTGYYKFLHKYSDNKVIIEHFTGFGLYDKTLLDKMRTLDDPLPFPRGVPAELGFDAAVIPYTQEKRRAGKSSNNLFSLYDQAMLGITAYTKIIPRLATVFGLTVSGISSIAAVVCLTLRLAGRGMSPFSLPLAGLFFLGGAQLFFFGLLGEYIVSLQRRSMKRPLVIEECRVNF
jgi:glycosyltransferase involved in cell wall biosynthesis